MCFGNHCNSCKIYPQISQISQITAGSNFFMNYFKLFIFFSVSLCLCGNLVFASNCNSIETNGEAAVENITPEEARQFALNRAGVKAIEGISNVNVKAITLALFKAS